MSFSGEIKEELSGLEENVRDRRLAELAAITSGAGQILIDEDDRMELEIRTENVTVARRFYRLAKTTFGIRAVVTLRKNEYLTRTEYYHLVIEDPEDTARALKELRVIDTGGEISEYVEQSQREMLKTSGQCWAFLRGCFLVSGSLSDPKKSYHLEIVCQQEDRAKVVQEIMHQLQLDARIVKRKKNYVVYLKEGEQILSFLAGIGTRQHLFEMENIWILKEMRNNLNRKVNCETANLNKTVSAAVRQIEDIRYIEAAGAFRTLPENLRQMAEIRLENPDVSLKELGEMLNPPVGKSGVNHRLRKLSEIAEGLRRKNQK